MARKKRKFKNKNIAARQSDSPSYESSPTLLLENKKSKTIQEFLLLALLVMTGFIIYSNNLNGPFLFDDMQNIRNNRYIRLTELSMEGIRQAAFESHASNRPVANISFALNYYFHQYDLTGYHIVNILIHLLTGLLLYFFIKVTLSLGIDTSIIDHRENNSDIISQLIPFFSALIWLVHPLQTQSVSYIVQRMNSLAAMFYVMAFLLYMYGRLSEKKRKKIVCFTSSCIAGCCALGSKEISATLPFFIFLYEWYFFQKLDWEWLKEYILIFAGISVLIGIFAVLYMGINPLETIMKTYEIRNFTLLQRVMTEFRVVIFYISLLIFPHPSRLNLLHDFPLSYSLSNPISTLFSLIVIAGFVFLAIRISKKEPLISFCILWYFGNLVMESSVIGLEIIFEHRNYLPSMFVSLLFVILTFKIIYLSLNQKKIWRITLFLVVIIFSLWTYQRNQIWGGAEEKFWKDCLEKSPNYIRLYNKIGSSLLKEGKIREAIVYFSKAVQIKPNYAASAHNNLGYSLLLQGKTEDAMNCFSRAIQIRKDFHTAYNNMGHSLMLRKKTKNAIPYFFKAIQLRPDFSEAHYNLATAFFILKKYVQSAYYYSESLRINPGSADAHYYLANTLIKQKKYKEAIHHYSEALVIRPDFEKARRKLEKIERKP